MITLARECRGLTQKDLADKLDISTGKLCRVEQDDQALNDEATEKLYKLLGFPSGFFYREGEAFLPNGISFRRRVKVAKKLLMPIEAQVNLHRLHVEILAEKMKLPAPKVPVLDLKEYGSPQEAAKELRKLWKVPAGPIKNVMALLEKHGILIVSFDFGTERVDSRTVLTKDKRPVIVLNKTLLGDRQRFSLAYELGHVVMHAFAFAEADRDIGHEANLFAAAFLMPEEDIRPDLQDNITIPLLADLKRKWMVSMQSLLYRASDLETITDNQKRYLKSQFHQLKIIRREPPQLDVPVETPHLLRDLITKYRNAQGLSVKGMAALLHLEPDEFMTRYAK